MRPRSVIGYTLGALGVLIVLASAAFAFWLMLHGASGIPILLYFTTLVGAALGWWGFFWVEPKRAVQGGDWLVNVQQRVAGRRKTDPVVAVPEAASASDGVGALPAPAQPVASDAEQIRAALEHGAARQRGE